MTSGETGRVPYVIAFQCVFANLRSESFLASAMLAFELLFISCIHRSDSSHDLDDLCWELE